MIMAWVICWGGGGQSLSSQHAPTVPGGARKRPDIFYWIAHRVSPVAPGAAWNCQGLPEVPGTSQSSCWLHFLSRPKTLRGILCMIFFASTLCLSYVLSCLKDPQAALGDFLLRAGAVLYTFIPFLFPSGTPTNGRLAAPGGARRRLEAPGGAWSPPERRGHRWCLAITNAF